MILYITDGIRPGGGDLHRLRRVRFEHVYNDIISIENLLTAWKEFLRGKRGRKDVQEFELRLMQNIIALNEELKDKTYKHSPYKAFKISDPKPRQIHKASVRDRLLHHAIYRKLYPFFDRMFISDSFSCRLEKGMHKAINRFRTFARRASLNHKRTVFVLKCDIRKFFASVDQYILLEIVKGYIPDKDIVGLISEIILVGAFLKEKLKLDLHPNKVSIRTVASGIDYLGWVHFPDHRVLRTVTKKRMIRGIRRRQGKMETVQSYLGVLSHGNGRRLCGRVDELAATYREKK